MLTNTQCFFAVYFSKPPSMTTTGAKTLMRLTGNVNKLILYLVVIIADSGTDSYAIYVKKNAILCLL